jgi:hypothetical protein
MGEDNRRYDFNVETGHFRVVPGSSNLLANTAAIVSESLSSPNEKSVIGQPLSNFTRQRLPPDTMGLQTKDAGDDPSNPNILSRHFKLVFISVLAITVLSGLAQIVMATFWSTPTGPQQEVFLAMGFAWKMGFGAIVGLLGGKLT